MKISGHSLIVAACAAGFLALLVGLVVMDRAGPGEVPKSAQPPEKVELQRIIEKKQRELEHKYNLADDSDSCDEPCRKCDRLERAMCGAEKGEAYSIYMLGEAYRDGSGVPQDPVEAYFWFSVMKNHLEMPKLEKQLTEAQIATVERRVKYWRLSHPGQERKK